MRLRTAALGALTLWPLLYAAFFIAVVAASASKSIHSLIVPFGLILTLHVVTSPLGFGLFVVYIRRVYRSPRIAPNHRLVWVAALLFGNIIVMPVYWWMYMWRQPTGVQ